MNKSHIIKIKEKIDFLLKMQALEPRGDLSANYSHPFCLEAKEKDPSHSGQPQLSRQDQSNGK